ASRWAIFRDARCSHHFLLRKLRAPNPKYWWSKTATPLLGAWLFVPAGMRARLLADWRCACGNFCNGPWRVNPFECADPIAGVLLLYGVGAGPPPDGVR